MSTRRPERSTPGWTSVLDRHVVGATDVRGDARVVRVEKGPSGLATEHAHGSGKAVGRHTAVGNDCDQQSVGEADTGAGVDDVRVARAVDLDELLSIARGGDGRVTEARGTRSSVRGGAQQLNCPSVPIWRRAATTMSPPASMRARETPSAERVSRARSRMNPFAMPPTFTHSTACDRP